MNQPNFDRVLVEGIWEQDNRFHKGLKAKNMLYIKRPKD